MVTHVRGPTITAVVIAIVAGIVIGIGRIVVFCRQDKSLYVSPPGVAEAIHANQPGPAVQLTDQRKVGQESSTVVVQVQGGKSQEQDLDRSKSRRVCQV